MRPSIFIGSSSEGLKIAEEIEKQLKKDADIDIWNKGVFKLNRSYLRSLDRAAFLHDFAILVITPDDFLTSRNKKYKVARDNVVFEHGLFMGRLGLRRAFLICDESVKVPSDYSGIAIAKYKYQDDLESALKEPCNLVRKRISELSNRSEISFLPSTSLAIGYYENFVKKVNNTLDISEEIKIEGKKVNCKSFTLTILIPSRLSDISPINLNKTVKGLNKNIKSVSVRTPYRDFPFFIKAVDTFGSDCALELFDLPATLLASKKAINVILADSSFGKSRDKEKLEQREIHNFRKTLDYLIEEDLGIDNKHIKTRDLSYLKNL